MFVETPVETQSSGHTNHPALPAPEGVPLAIATAIEVLFPIATEYAGRKKAMGQLLGERLTWQGIKHWRRGRRSAPLWAITLLRQELDRRIHAMQHASALLQVEEKKKAGG